MDFSWMKLFLDTFVFLLLSKFHLYWLKHVKFCIVLFAMRCCAWVCLFFFRLFCFPKLCRYGWKRAWFCPRWCLTCMLCSTSPVHANTADTCFPVSPVSVAVPMYDVSLVSKAYHLRREETDWFDKPRESRLENSHGLDRKLPERLVHSRPLSQHQEQVSEQFYNLSKLLTTGVNPKVGESVHQSIDQSSSRVFPFANVMKIVLCFISLLHIVMFLPDNLNDLFTQ